ncbi:unnamed protein product [Allacma fusca]|uniref:Peptidase metallopeptidase domain-containing protein n=1 Tax=Allacma fusca TaxID=39272 RepID=A0A8J2PBH2_9HEXA|nr:unnamed protein product [Allacma fusca]
MEGIKSLWYDYPHFDFESVYHPLDIWNRVVRYSKSVYNEKECPVRGSCWHLVPFFVYSVQKVIMLYVLLMVLLQVSLGAYGTVVEDESDALHYLARFGYVSEDALTGMNLVDASPFIKQFQEMMGINVTGKLDKETLKMMNAPRCGNPDVHQKIRTENRRSKRYVLTQSRWEKRDVTYRISEFSRRPGVSEALVDRDVQRAFQLWQDVTNLNFIKVDRGDADIDIRFLTGDHGDLNSFDGPGKTLAHAFSPGLGLGGDVHFDDHEHWTSDSPDGFNTLFVATHEIGHALGLDHSKEKHSIMAAAYAGYRPHLQLHPDDIQGIQAIYGRKESRSSFRGVAPPIVPPENYFMTQPTSVPRRPTRIPEHRPQAETDLCKNPKIDAIASLPDRSVTIFTGSYFYLMYPDIGRLDANGRTIGSIFKTVDNNIDAAFGSSNGYTYIFKGEKYWRFRDFTLSQGYPKTISEQFPGIPNDIDAAFEWPKNKRIYFFKGDKLWAFNRFRKPPVSNRYPLQVTELNLPSNIDAAFVAPNGHCYLFKGSKYWRLDDYDLLKVAEAQPPYPRDTRLMWFQCDKNKPKPEEI